MCASMADIQSTDAEIWQGKKEEEQEKEKEKKKERRRKEETAGQKYNGLPYYIGRS